MFKQIMLAALFLGSYPTSNYGDKVFSTATLRALSGHVDAELLKAHADSLRVPYRLVWGIAWMESRDGRKPNSKILGPGVLVQVKDTTYREWRDFGKGQVLVHVTTVTRTKHVCREIGRMQLSPCTDWVKLLNDSRCTLKRITNSLSDNVHCGVKYLRTLKHKYGHWKDAPLHYNGASIYQDGVEQYLGRLDLREYS